MGDVDNKRFSNCNNCPDHDCYLILRLGKMCQVSGVKKPPGKELYFWSLKSRTYCHDMEVEVGGQGIHTVILEYFNIKE